MLTGFDLLFPNNLTKAQWVLLRELESNNEIRELCPEPTYWTYTINTDNARQAVSELAKLHDSIVLINSED